MKKITLLTTSIFLLSLLQQPHAQMAPARSDAYQGNYAIKTGYGPNYGLKYNADGTTYVGTEDPTFIIPSIHFQLYNGLKLQSSNPTANTTTGNTARSLKINGATAYPYFNMQPQDAQGNNIFNWTNWMYPFTENGITPYAGTATNRDGALLFSPWQADVAAKRNYKDYNKLYYGNTNWFTMGTTSGAPTMMYNRINQQRDKIIISLWVGYMSLDMQRQNAMMDLRVSALDAQTKLYTRTWFSNPDNADVGLFGNPEYNKIRTANTYWAPKNAENGGLGRDILNYNADMDGLLYLAPPAGNYGITARTEGASEITGLRTIAYNNDPDPCTQNDINVTAKFRVTTVGGYGAATGDPNASLGRYYHPGDPYQLSNQYFLNINISRPTIAFPGVTCGSLGPEILMVGATTGNINPIGLNITEAAGALLPGTETNTPTAVTIDPSRVRVSLVLRSVYDAAVADGSIATNNDLPVISGFAYLTQANLAAIENTIPTGEYVIKYDYSAPDSKTDIKTEGDKLGEVFAKSIYRPLIVTSGLPVTFDMLEAKIKSGQLVVNWTTLKETDNSHFEIEVSTDGKNFKNAGRMNSEALNGNSTNPISYTFTRSINTVSAAMAVMALLGLSFAGFANRKKLIAGLMIMGIFVTLYACTKNTDAVPDGKDMKIFVRIAQIDKDGKTTYSKTIEAIKE